MEGDRTLPGVVFVAASGRAFLFLRFYCAAILPAFCLAFFTRKDCYVQNPVICCGWREIHIRQKIHIARSVWNERCSWDAGREIWCNS